MENNNLSEEERFYVFEKFPENIRQIGEQPENGRIYVEDYVVTYMHRIFREKAESSLVVFVGKRGEGETQGSIFIFGAIEVEMDILSWKEQFTARVWDDIHAQLHQYFSGGEVLGWGCGVNIGSSQIKKAVAGIQRKHFSRDGQVLFYMDYSEEEENVCRWENGSVCSVPGYLIYYGKNPKMQEYMLRGEKKESFEADYDDSVIENVRAVIKNKEKRKQEKKPAFFAAGSILLVLTILGAWLLVQSNQKIESLESAILTLSQSPEEGSSKKMSENNTSPPKKEAEKPSGKQDTASSAAGSFEPFEQKSQATAEPDASAGAKSDQAAQKPSTVQGGKATPKPKEPVSAKPTEKATAKPAAKVTAKPTPAAVPSFPPAEKKQPQGKKNSIPRASSYVVQQGDTLSQIVWRQYHTTAYLEQVKRANNIENEDEIQIGQRIILPVFQK